MIAVIVTIDGPAGTGKSTVAGELARRLGLELLDTGAMYRGVAALALDHDLDPADEDSVAELARRADLRFAWGDDPPFLTAFSASINHRLRDEDVTDAVSVVAGLAKVREVLVETQRRIGREHPRLVSEGRDQGSVVFPHADVKFYMDAEPEVRAKRRVEQMRAAGIKSEYDSVLERIIERDRRDAERKVGPLICPPGAIVIDTTPMDQLAVVRTLEAHVRERVHAAALATKRG